MLSAGVVFTGSTLSAQDGMTEGSPFELKGYLTNMQSVMFENPDESWIADNLFHNRLNFFYYGNNLSASLQFRNRLMYGGSFNMFQGYDRLIEQDIGWMDLSWNLLSGNSYVLNSTIDRVWLKYSTGVFEATVGRQRINWGQTFVWNVNDIFNAYSYFDFDYEERPGSDAVRLQFYPNYTSTIEIAAKLDSANKVTAAALYRVNVFSYDIQFLAGVLNEEDYIGGVGWSGNIGGAGFRAEGTYFHPVDKPKDTTGMVMFSAGLDYAFPSTLMLQAEYLYSSNPLSASSGLLDIYAGPLTVKQLAFAEHSLFAAGSYQITPLFQATLAGMYFPELKGFFAGPSMTYNVLDNVDLSFFLQYFNAENKNPASGRITRQQISLLFLRLKWNF